MRNDVHQRHDVVGQEHALRQHRSYLVVSFRCHDEVCLTIDLAR